MSEQQNRDVLDRRFAAFERHDIDAFIGLLDDDYVEEYPQSGERIRGRDNRRKIPEKYPGGLPSVIDHRYEVSGDLAVIETTLEYGGNRIYVCEMVEFEGGKMKRARAYFGEPFEPPEWRAHWVERM